MQRKQILILTPRYPYPVIGGDRLRIYEICKELAKYHDLSLLSLCETQDELYSALPDDGVFKRIERVYLPKWQSLLNVALAIPTSTPLQIAYYRSNEFARKLDALVPEHDMFFAHLIRAGEYLRGRDIPSVLEMTDAISMNYQRISKLSSKRNFKSWVFHFEANRLLSYEQKIVDEFPLVTLVSDFDRDFLLNGRVLDNLLVCSNGVDLSALPFRSREVSAPIAAFIGNMTSVQNLDACFYFAEEVLPVIRQRLDCRFRVVGRIKPGDAKRLEMFDSVEVASNVHSIADALADARVGVAPVRLGAGVQNKVLEYMALGLPVVTSTVALEGLQAMPERDLLVADRPEEYAAALLRLWQDDTLRGSLAQAGLKYVEEYHSWHQRLMPMVERINRILAD